ncbi:hypothetical protein HPB49_013880 [Dermacentor silvarum]|uniref:Uncharacterized protein n=1 Tax=Dermacentor silvarum TaxID=543639 RepID=A0ACB8DP26_DERSI|nr:hypothetical protein HPB49_013880 [Dermacentor silvarum]
MLALYLFTTHHDIGWVGGTASLTGWVLLVVLTVMVVCSLPCLRRSGRFEVFYFTHLLYTVFWFVLVLHAPNFWKWFLVPGLLLAMEMLVRACRFFSSYGMTTVLKGVILPSKVIHLVLKKPPDFDYHPGDYIYLNIPCLARFEWHPFTISSGAREGRRHMASYPLLWWLDEPPLPVLRQLQARSLRASSIRKGERFGFAAAFNGRNRGCLPGQEQAQGLGKRGAHAPGYAAEGQLRLSGHRPRTGGHCRQRPRDGGALRRLHEPDHRQEPLTVRIDGPYGSPSSHIFQAQHAVLVAAGIGVTPFASILQSIMYRYYQARSTCPQCSHCWVEKLPSSVMKLRKVDFIGSTAASSLSSGSRSWATSLERFLDVHIYITSALSRTDMKAVGLQLALDLLHEKDKRCRYRGQEPDPARQARLGESFPRDQGQKKGKVTVFYCGPPSVEQILHDHATGTSLRSAKKYFKEPT